MRQLHFAPLLCLLGTFVAANDGEYFGSSTNCAISCPTETTKFSYKDGTVHVFDYYSSVKFFGGDRTPQIGMISRAEFTVVSKCEMILLLSDIKTDDESSPTADVYAKFSEDLQKNSLRFGFVDGEIVSVCAAKDEPLWALNYKRGILSTFQNSMSNLASATDETIQETDIGGDCSSLYKSEHRGTDIYNVTRIRSPSACVAPQAPPTNKLPSQLLQALPIIRKEQKCFQTISNGKLKKSTCREDIRFTWNNQDNEPVMTATTSLNHVNEFASDFVVVPTYEASRSGLAIQWKDSSNDEAPADWLSLASELIESLSGFQPTPDIFYQLTELLKLFKYEQLNDLFLKISPEYWRNTAMSILQIGTEPSIKFIMDNFLGVQYDEKNEDSLKHMIKTQETSASVVDLLMEMQFEELSEYKLKDYCMKNISCYDDPSMLEKFEILIQYSKDLDCSISPPKKVLENETVNEFENMMDQYLENETNNEFENTMDQNLRNLRLWNNVGYFNKSIASNVTQCIKQNHDINVKLAALEVIRNVPCSWFDYKDLVQNGEGNSDQYSNIMIYLSLIRCPPDNMSTYIRGKFIDDIFNQETSFIWSHLSNMNNEFSKTIVNDRSLSPKYSHSSKFSRNIKKNIYINDKVFIIESDIIFDEQQLIPKYAHMKLQINNTINIDLLDIEMQEFNKTRSVYDKPIMYVTVRIRGNTVCKKKVDSPELDIITGLQMIIFNIGMEMFSSITYSFMVQLMKMEHYPTFIRDDINLYYPTSVGMPFHIKLNKTEGTYLREDEINQYYTMQKDASLILDASHTIIGTNIRASIKSFPTCNVSIARDYRNSWEWIAMYPEEKNTILEMNFGFSNIENYILTPRYTKKESELISDCFSTFSPIFGSMICYDYTPCPDSWEFSNLKYKVSLKREPTVEGEILVWYSDDLSSGIEYTKISKLNETYMFDLATLGTFGNFQIATPRLDINGSGTIKADAFNISGKYINRYESPRVIPFTFVGAVTEDEQMNKTRFEAVLECTDFYADFLIVVLSSGANYTVTAQIPYNSKTTGVKNMFEIAYGQELTKKNQSTAEEDSCYLLYAHLNSTEWPHIKTDAKVYVHDFNENYDIAAYGSASCNDYKINCSIDGAWNDTMNIVSFTNITGPNNLQISINKTLESFGYDYKLTKEMKKNGEICYELEVNAGMTEMGALYGNMSFEIPLANQSYPLVKLEISKKINFMLNKYQLTCNKSYRNKSLGFNFTAGPVGVGDSMESMILMSMQEDKHYRADVSITCDDYSKRILFADSKITNSLQDMDLSVEVKTPFKRWYEPGMKMKLLKKGSTVKATMKTMDSKYGEQTRMEFSALSDYDIATNLLDTYK